VHRREVLHLASVPVVGSVAGCAGGDRHAQSVATVVANERDVREWEVTDDRFTLEFVTGGDRAADIRIVGDAYAGGVQSGLAVPLSGAALDTGGAVQYRFDIRVAWAESLNGGEIGQEEYRDRIAATI